LTHLEYGVLDRAGFIVITGEIGTGKTTLLRYLLRSFNKNLPVAFLTQTCLNPEDLLRALCQEFSLPHENKGKPEMIELFGAFQVEQYRQGQYVILILDEAQNLPSEALEEIRMLSNLDTDNECLLQVILVGQPPLRRNLQHRELRQLYQRVEVSYHLEPLDQQELKDYIRYRLATAGRTDPELFDDDAMEAIFDYSGGVPRLINAVCHGCLVYGFADTRKKIQRDLVEAVLKDRCAGVCFHKPTQLKIRKRLPRFRN
jgi:general secretion pathway protein A